MRKNARSLVLELGLLLGFGLLLGGCGGGGNESPSAAVHIQKAQNAYYEVVMDYAGRSSSEMGRALAEEILRVVPDYEIIADSLLEDQFLLLARHGLSPDFPMALARAQAISLRKGRAGRSAIVQERAGRFPGFSGRASSYPVLWCGYFRWIVGDRKNDSRS